MRHQSETDNVRALDFKRRLKEAGLSIAEFGRRSGLTRNVVYRLSKGQQPKGEQQVQIDRVLSGR